MRPDRGCRQLQLLGDSLHGMARGEAQEHLELPLRETRYPGLFSAVDLLQCEPVRKADIEVDGDRKSTRLNSSHTVISYAVFCLKKKKHKSTNYSSTFSPKTLLYLSLA